MRFNALHPSECANPPFSNSTDALSNRRHGSGADFDSGNLQDIDLSPHLLDLDSLHAIEGSYHTGEYSNPCHGFVRQGSIPMEQLMKEVLWPQKQQDGPQREGEQQQQQQRFEEITQLVPREESISKSLQHDANTENSSTSQTNIVSGNGTRRRGRPRLYPTTTDAHTPGVTPDVTSDSRASQLAKNRIAAEKCRRRRKENTNKLVADLSILSSKNEKLKAQESALREELLDLKNKILSHASCNSSLIDEYVAKTAGSQLVEAVAPKYTLPRKDSGQETDDGDEQPYTIPRRNKADREPQTIPYLVVPNPYDATDSYNSFDPISEFLDGGGG